jgi:hypothetical protein
MHRSQMATCITKRNHAKRLQMRMRLQIHAEKTVSHNISKNKQYLHSVNAFLNFYPSNLSCANLNNFLKSDSPTTLPLLIPGHSSVAANSYLSWSSLNFNSKG